VPAAEGLALATARFSGAVVTFSIQIKAAALTNFPRLIMSGDNPIGDGRGTIANQGAMLAATASILRYYQGLSQLPTPNGLADPASLNQYLSAFCVRDLNGAQLCDGYFTPSSGSPERIVNLWRVGGYVGGRLDVQAGGPGLSNVRDAVGSGTPVLLALSLTVNGAPLGSHYVVGTGLAADGSIVIQDPSPVFSRTSLSQYLEGFTVGARAYKGTLSSLALPYPRLPSGTGFLVASLNAPVAVSSAVGSCGGALEIPSVAAVPGDAPAAPPDTFRAFYCDGAQPVYQIDSTAANPFKMSLTDLGAAGSRVDLSGGGQAAFKVTRQDSHWSAAAEEVSFTAASVVNAATFQPGIAPGSLMAIFGAGLAGPGGASQVEVAGAAAAVVTTSPFQLNVQVPLETAPGAQSVVVRSPYGVARQPVDISLVAPAIFVSGTQGAVLNQDYSLNSSLNPGRRGQTLIVYCTGLGAVSAAGQLSPVRKPVTVLLQGRELQPAFAGLAPSFIGLYQVNVPVPSDLPPGLDLPLALSQENVQSNAVGVSLQ
jgi:uncharacterized protein (TIGR03437 family)